MTNERAKAFERVIEARGGSLLEDSTLEYLYSLQEFVQDWLKSINDAIRIREKEEWW